MTEATRTWNVTETQWETLCRRTASTTDVLEDGGYARVEPGEGVRQSELRFYATPLNKPDDWRYPFAEAIPDSRTLGAFLGRAWHDPATGFVHFEVIVYAAAQAVRADYESGVSDLDYVTYEQEVERAVAGTAGDEAWLVGEFARLMNVTAV